MILVVTSFCKTFHIFLSFSSVFSWCVNNDMFDGCREYMVLHVSSSQGEVSMLSTHAWNANFTVQLLRCARWQDEKSQSLLDKLNNEVKHFNGGTGGGSVSPQRL
jgi:hypothetical protein